MFTRCFKRPKTRFLRNRICRNKCGGYTYSSVLQASRSNGVTVNGSRLCDCSKPLSCTKTGLLRYKKQWEQKEADIFVNNQVLTGTLFFTAPDTLRVVGGECSFFVPLDQIAGMRIL